MVERTVEESWRQRLRVTATTRYAEPLSFPWELCPVGCRQLTESGSSHPPLVVCGDQSSGKSSVLEAITEIPFPRRDNLCTRFATQIMLRRSPTTHARVKIIPDSQRNAADRAKLEKFTGEIQKLESLPDLVEDAKAAMGIDNGEGAFSKDTLSIEVGFRGGWRGGGRCPPP